MILRQRRDRSPETEPPAAHPVHGQDPGVLPSGESRIMFMFMFMFIILAPRLHIAATSASQTRRAVVYFEISNMCFIDHHITTLD